MKHLLLLPALVSGFLPLVSLAQQAPPDLHVTTPTTWDADWPGEPYRVYFAQWSSDLENWVYLPTMKFGEAMHGIGASVSGEKGFLRLQYYDNYSIADLSAAKFADFDRDSLSNWDEVTLHGTDPTNPDSDGDGLPDGFEILYSYSPLLGDSNGNGTLDGDEDEDGDGLILAEEFALNGNPRLADTDGDGTNDSRDGAINDPASGAVNQRLQAITAMRGIEMSASYDDGENQFMSWSNAVVRDYHYAYSTGDFISGTSLPPVTTPYGSYLGGLLDAYRPWHSVFREQMAAVHATKFLSTYCRHSIDPYADPAVHYYQFLNQEVKLRLRRFGDVAGEGHADYLLFRSSGGGGFPYEFEDVEAVKLPFPAGRSLSETLLIQNPVQTSEDFIYANAAPVLLTDARDTSVATDDTDILPWAGTGTQIVNANIALIAAHTSAQDVAPRMPQLEFHIPNLPVGFVLEAKMKIVYQRGNGARPDIVRLEDTVKIPADDTYAQVPGNTWRIWEAYAAMPYFGGDAIITYRLMENGVQRLAPTTFRFRIGGENPDDARCRAYIESLPNAGGQGNLWFAYAVAKSESADYNLVDSRYNQFYELPRNEQDTNYRQRRLTHAGRPVFGDDRDSDGNPVGPGGYGIFQVTGNASSSTADIPREQIWNWQKSVSAGLTILNPKRTAADNWMTQQRNADNADGVTLPNHTVRDVLFSEGTVQDMESAVAMKNYNGASRPPAGFADNGIAPGFRIATDSGHYCFWRNSSSDWTLSRMALF